MLVYIDGPCGPIVPAQHQQPPIGPYFAELAYIPKNFFGTTTKCSSLKGLRTMTAGSKEMSEEAKFLTALENQLHKEVNNWPGVISEIYPADFSLHQTNLFVMTLFAQLRLHSQ